MALSLEKIDKNLSCLVLKIRLMALILNLRSQKMLQMRNLTWTE